MSESGRKIRSTEERISEIDAKIEFHKNKISILEEKKKAILNPERKQRKKGLKSLMKDSGLTDDEIAKALGFKNALELAEKLAKK